MVGQEAETEHILKELYTDVCGEEEEKEERKTPGHAW